MVSTSHKKDNSLSLLQIQRSFEHYDTYQAARLTQQFEKQPNMSNSFQASSQQLTTKKTARLVSFSCTSLMTIIGYPTPEEKKYMWYSHEDLEGFKRVLAQDISKCSQMVNGATSDLLTEHDLLHSMGLESFLQQDVTKRIIRMRKAHLQRILFEQDRQRILNTYSVEEIARLSAISSGWSMRRSHAIAVLHMKHSG